jgi:uncharacterized protein YdeI (YjbR/CyaY-like superfamily)
MKPIFFPAPEDFRKWLEDHHQSETELWVGFYKVGSGKPSITWSQSVDQALCYGWIDGVRKSIDNESYCIRFSPRRPNSNWSALNIRKIEELRNKGLLRSAGLAAFSKRKEKKSEVYSYENKPAGFPPSLEELFKSKSNAWEFYNQQSPYYQKATTHWVMSGKQEATRLRRLEKLIRASDAGLRLI